MKTPEQILTELSKPFTRVINGQVYPDIHWLPKDGKSMKNKIICVPYLSGGQVRDRLNEVLGVYGWMFTSQLETDGTRTGKLSLKIGDDWIDRDGTGTQSREEKEKGAETDALKRAGRNFGIGAYLEQLPPQFVSAKANTRGKMTPVDNQGRFLFGKNLDNYLNGFSSEQGILAQLMILNPQSWELPELKSLWNHFKK